MFCRQAFIWLAGLSARGIKWEIFLQTADYASLEPMILPLVQHPDDACRQLINILYKSVYKLSSVQFFN